MKTLKISLVATIAASLGWWLRLPHKIWPEHPRFTDFLLALGLCIVLQVVWPDPDKKSKAGIENARTIPPK
jgi:hypothetical protein